MSETESHLPLKSPDPNPPQKPIGVWTYKEQLICIADQAFWLVRLKEENEANAVKRLLAGQKLFPAELPGWGETSIIPFEMIQAVRAIQEWEETATLHVDHQATAGKIQNKEIVFAQGEDRDHAVACLNQLANWQSETIRVDLRAAIQYPMGGIALISGAALFYWTLASFRHGQDFGDDTWAWLLLHLPLNVVGIKWVSLILGGLALLLVAQLAHRVIWPPFQLVLVPPGKSQIPETGLVDLWSFILFPILGIVLGLTFVLIRYPLFWFICIAILAASLGTEWWRRTRISTKGNRERQERNGIGSAL